MFRNKEANRTYVDHSTSHSEIGWVTTARDFCGELISGQSTSGRILVIVANFNFKEKLP